MLSVACHMYMYTSILKLNPFPAAINQKRTIFSDFLKNSISHEWMVEITGNKAVIVAKVVVIEQT